MNVRGAGVVAVAAESVAYGKPENVDTTLNSTVTSVMSNGTTFKAIYDSAKLLFRQQLQFKNVKIFELPFEVLDRSDEYVGIEPQCQYNAERYVSFRECSAVEIFSTNVPQE
jgi:hypothetical protein